MTRFHTALSLLLVVLLAGSAYAAPLLPAAFLRDRVQDEDLRQVIDQLEQTAATLSEASYYGGIYLSGSDSQTLTTAATSSNVTVFTTDYPFDKGVTLAAASGNVKSGVASGTYSVWAGAKVRTTSPYSNNFTLSLIEDGTTLDSQSIRVGPNKGLYEIELSTTNCTISANSIISLGMTAQTNGIVIQIDNPYLFISGE